MTGLRTGSGAALLVLEDGRVFRGEVFGAAGAGFGEAVFATGMTGYQETLTDPSYHRQIVVQTAPQIGNTGWNDEDDESAGIQVAGYVVRDPSRIASNWRSRRSLDDALREQGVVGVAGIDTRALVRHLRERGAMRAGVFSGDALDEDGRLVERVRASPEMAGADLYGAVTTHEPYVVHATVAKRFTVAAIDVGIKSNTPRMLAARGIETHVLPAGTTIEQIEDLGADGVFLSNGPGDPATAEDPVALTRHVLERRIPLFGICFGNQILGRALGRGTYKMRYGHRGINIPVIEHETGRVAITSQNHGFAVVGEAGERFDTPFGPAVITHTCSNDGTVEGMRALDVPAFSVQYHPEAAAGPHDAADLFDRFVDLMAEATGRGRHRLFDPPPGVAPPADPTLTLEDVLEQSAVEGPAVEGTPEAVAVPPQVPDVAAPQVLDVAAPQVGDVAAPQVRDVAAPQAPDVAAPRGVDLTPAPNPGDAVPLAHDGPVPQGFDRAGPLVPEGGSAQPPDAVSTADEATRPIPLDSLRRAPQVGSADRPGADDEPPEGDWFATRSADDPPDGADPATTDGGSR